MEQKQIASRHEQREMLWKLNLARIMGIVSLSAESAALDQTIEEECKQWFEQHHVPLKMDENNFWYEIEEGPVLSISRETHESILRALFIHDVLLSSQASGEIKAKFPAGTKREQQENGQPGQFLLTLPDGWQVQEMELLERPDLPYRSILIFVPEHNPLHTKS